MRQLLIIAIGMLVFWAMAYGSVNRIQRVKMAGCGLLLVAVGVFQAYTMYDLQMIDVLLLNHQLPRFNSTLIVDFPLVIGYGFLAGAVLSMFFPVRSRD